MFSPKKPFSPKFQLLTTSMLAGCLLGPTIPIVPAIATLSVEATPSSIEPAPPIAPALEVPAATETAPAAIVAPAPLSVDSAEPFIDRSNDYSLGATQPAPDNAPSGYEPPSEIVIIPGTQNAPEVTQTAGSSVQVGSVNLSAAGISYSAPEEPIYSANSTSSSYASVSPGLPYLNPKLFQAFARMGNDNLRLLFPVAIPAPITSLFGWRVHPISGSQRMHTGTDIGAPMGAPVLAALSGRVIMADSMGGYGLAVAIEHDNGVRQTMYAHLSAIFVKPGDKVQQGAVIGQVGSTGASTGPHLHFEFRQMMPDGTWVALDAGQHLNLAMGDLVKSLQIATQPAKSIAQKPTKATP